MNKLYCIFLSALLGICMGLDAKAEEPVNIGVDLNDPRMRSTSNVSVEHYKDNQNKFVIKGTVSPSLNYKVLNIYLADIDKGISENDLATTVPVVDNKFTVTLDVDRIKRGRLWGAVREDGDLKDRHSVYMNMYVVPGVTVNLKIEPSEIVIENPELYDFMVYAWLNKDALQYMLGFERGLSVKDDSFIKMQRRVDALRAQQLALRQQMLSVLEEIKKAGGDKKMVDAYMNDYLNRIRSLNIEIEQAIKSY